MTDENSFGNNNEQKDFEKRYEALILEFIEDGGFTIEQSKFLIRKIYSQLLPI